MRQLLSGVALVLALWPAVALAGGDDVILLTNGGRLRGTVMEADPERGVRFLLADGGVRFLLPSDIAEVRYGGQAGAPAPAPGAAPPSAPPPAAPPQQAQPLPPPAPAAQPAPMVTPPPPPPSEAAPSPWREGGAASKVIQLSARLGYATPMGSMWGTDLDSNGSFSDQPMSDIFSSKVPIGIEAAFGLSKRFALGASLYYGVIYNNQDAGKVCGPPAKCDDHDWELGIFALINIAPDRILNPWVGFGLGYEIVSWSHDFPSRHLEGSLTGLQYAKLMGGLDLKISDGMSLGPYLSYSMGIYSTQTISGGTEQSLPAAFHEWAGFGIRGSFGFIDRDFED